MQRSRPLKILGLTGSIGMGKSFVAFEMKKRSINVFNADEEVAAILRDKKIVSVVQRHFPNTIVNGEIDKVKLGGEVFGNKQKLSLLEQALYPELDKKLEIFIRQNHDLIALDVPLLYEKSYDHLCDYVILVSASRETQIKRLMERPNMSTEKIEAILSHQLPDSEKRKRADFIIDTDASYFHTILQLENILRQIRGM